LAGFGLVILAAIPTPLFWSIIYIYTYRYGT